MSNKNLKTTFSSDGIISGQYETTYKNEHCDIDNVQIRKSRSLVRHARLQDVWMSHSFTHICGLEAETFFHLRQVSLVATSLKVNKRKLKKGKYM